MHACMHTHALEITQSTYLSEMHSHVLCLNTFIRTKYVFNDHVSAYAGCRRCKTNKCYGIMDDSDAIWFAFFDGKLYDIPFARKGVKS